MIENFAKLFEFYKDAVIILQNRQVVYQNSAAAGIFSEDMQESLLGIIDSSPQLAQTGGAIVAMNAQELLIARFSDYIICTIYRAADNRAALYPEDKVFSSAFADIRDSLAILSILANNLSPQLEKLSDPSMHKYAAILRRNYYSLKRKVNNLDELCGIGQPPAEQAFTLVDMTELCGSLADTINFLTHGQTAPIQFSSPGAPLLVRGSYDKLYQMLLNLLSNSLKYTADGAPIQLRLSEGNDHVTISVIDNGRGIPPETMQHLFQRYAKAPDLSDGKAGGGIGLSLVSNIARLHGGVAVVESEFGSGTHVTISLPLATGSGLLRAQEAEYNPFPRILTELSDVLDLEAYSQKYTD